MSECPSVKLTVTVTADVPSAYADQVGAELEAAVQEVADRWAGAGVDEACPPECGETGCGDCDPCDPCDSREPCCGDPDSCERDDCPGMADCDDDPDSCGPDCDGCFGVGDVVYLECDEDNDCPMTVEGVCGGLVAVVYLDGDRQPARDEFPADCLTY